MFIDLLAQGEQDSERWGSGHDDADVRNAVPTGEVVSECRVMWLILFREILGTKHKVIHVLGGVKFLVGKKKKKSRDLAHIYKHIQAYIFHKEKCSILSPRSKIKDSL